MTGYERGIAAERELLMKEFEHKHQTAPFDVSPIVHHEAENDYAFDHRDRYHHTNDEQLAESNHGNNLVDPIELDGGINLVGQDGMLTSGQSGDTVHDNRDRQAFRFTAINTETPVQHTTSEAVQ